MNVQKYLGSGSAGGRLAVAAVVTSVGVALGRAAGPGPVMDLVTGEPYFLLVTALLAIGLYSSTHGIELRHLRADLRTVVLAVTVGVLVKAVLITAVMVVLFPGPEALVLGVAVAQIDPLSVSALQHSSRMSERGKALLLSWASFDDPVTTLLTIYAATLSVTLHHLDGSAEFTAFTAGGAGGVLLGLAANLALAAVFTGTWFFVRGRIRARRGSGADLSFAVACGLLLAAAAVAVSQFWMLGIALLGLFVRPVVRGAPEAFARVLDGLTQTAFLLAVLGVGVILSVRVDLAAGLVLGVTAFAAQAVVSVFLTRAQEPGDRIPLAIAQQNGITAIILALLLQPMFPAVVGIVAPAVLVVNVLHLVANALYARYDRGDIAVPLPGARWWAGRSARRRPDPASGRGPGASAALARGIGASGDRTAPEDDHGAEDDRLPEGGLPAESGSTAHSPALVHGTGTGGGPVRPGHVSFGDRPSAGTADPLAPPFGRYPAPPPAGGRLVALIGRFGRWPA
ncbi:NhaP-type Na+/H+ or K+/H+ antiporter [Thermomonospora echinospora]|uniref:NhaP-type Na+/H+ or K+/H+ antiporter n=1 Tax=Thermomonospora echinospora TaxID=1992 RepID=A0A1H5ZV56_9ACTN|nr:hypothetical protein [Thermomonospora echinospora]SEG40413.1 NhaP-type Na+/H+ or K+/H+ antiporter [Thermomonospora echinospora]